MLLIGLLKMLYAGNKGRDFSKKINKTKAVPIIFTVNVVRLFEV